jgi:hypothetical protein
MSKLVKVRKFNQNGIKLAKEILISKSEFDQKVLFDENYSEPYSNLEIDLEVEISKRSDLAKYLHKALKAEIDSENKDGGLWTWLLFAYFDFLVRRKDGKPHPLSNSSHYIFTLKGDRSEQTYRHLVYSFYKAYELWGDKSAIFDGVKNTLPFTWTDIAEQFLSRQGLFSFFEILYDLFADPVENCLKPNVAGYFSKEDPWDKQRIKNTNHYKGYGGYRRWIKKMDQLSRIYRFHAMKSKEIRAVFSPEF